MVKIVDLNDKWALLIGKMFIAMGSIEYKVNKLLADVCASERIKKEVLTKRTQYLIQNIENENIKKLLSDILRIIRHRNFIAHNTLVLNILGKDIEPFQEIIINNQGKEEYLDFEKLSEIVNQTENLLSRLASIAHIKK